MNFISKKWYWCWNKSHCSFRFFTAVCAPKVVEKGSCWQMAQISTKKPPNTNTGSLFCVLYQRLRERVCAQQWIDPQCCPRHFGVLTVQIVGSRWGPIWHDYGAASHLVEPQRFNKRSNQSEGHHSVTGLLHVVRRLGQALIQHTYWHCKHV